MENGPEVGLDMGFAALRAVVGEGLCEVAENEKAILAGGMLTRVFSKEGGGDLDFFFTMKEHADNFVKSVWGEYKYRIAGTIPGHGYAAVLTKEGEPNIHVIQDPCYPNARSVIDSFDFSVCMAAYDFGKGEFTLGDAFLQDARNREFTILKPYLLCPIRHLIRITKYLNRGYRLLNPEILETYKKKEKEMIL